MLNLCFLLPVYLEQSFKKVQLGLGNNQSKMIGLFISFLKLIIVMLCKHKAQRA